MQPGNYVYQLRTLRALELAKNRDLTTEAVTVFNLRLNTINRDEPDPEKRAALVAAAERQWSNFMQRPLVAQG